jgi:hypothetical protein
MRAGRRSQKHNERYYWLLHGDRLFGGGPHGDMFGRKYRLPTIDPAPTLSTQLHRKASPKTSSLKEDSHGNAEAADQW